MNIIETIQKNLGFSPLIKINPNTQEPEGHDTSMGNNALVQAAIPSILIGIYNRLEMDADISHISDPKQTGGLLDSIFGKSKNEVVKHINAYAKNQDKHNDQQLEHIASECLRVICDGMGDDKSEASVRNFVSKNKPDALLYLPASIELGKILSNNNLDDRTGKMEGPVSSFMHKMEKTFNTSSS
jgi:hypothetical protein